MCPSGLTNVSENKLNFQPGFSPPENNKVHVNVQFKKKKDPSCNLQTQFVDFGQWLPSEFAN